MGKKKRRAKIRAEEKFDRYGNQIRLSETRAKKNPQKAQAQLIEAQRRDFERRFRPLEDRLRDEVTGDTEDEATRAGENAVRQSAVTRGEFNRNLSRTATTLTKRQGETVARKQGLADARNIANAKNQARRTTRDTNLSRQAELIGIGRGVQQSANKDLSAAASMQASREVAGDQASAAKKSQNTQMLATAAGIAAAFFL